MKKFLTKHKSRILRYIIASILFIVFVFLLAFYHRQTIININQEKLQILANEKSFLINLFLESQKEKLLILASMDVFKDIFLYPNDKQKIENAKKMIDGYKGIISGLSVLTNKGIVITGEIDLPNTDYSQHPYFAQKRENEISFGRYYDPLRKDNFYAITSPIYSENKIIGRIAFDVSLSEINELMVETILEGSAEVYLIDGEGLLLSRSKYIGQKNNGGILIQEVKNEGTEECFEHYEKYGRGDYVEEHKEDILKYLNYMGDEVFGVHAYSPIIKGCFIAEEKVGEVKKLEFKNIFKNFFRREEGVY